MGIWYIIHSLCGWSTGSCLLLFKYIEVCEIFDNYFMDSFIGNLIGDFGICRCPGEFYLCFLYVWLLLLPRQKPRGIQLFNFVLLLHPLMMGTCLLSLVRNSSYVKVNSVLWMVRSNVDINASFCSHAACCMNSILGLSLARHSHHIVLHV